MEKRKPLIMLYPQEHAAATSTQLPEGYSVKTFETADKGEYLQLLEAEGWKLSEDKFEDYLRKVLPHGLFLAVDRSTGEIAATAAALQNPESSHFTFPEGGEIGFVRTHPNHRRRGLGLHVTALAANRLKSSDCKSIRIVTNDERLPALKTYLKLGFVPFLYSSDMEERWIEIVRKLRLNMISANWIQSDKHAQKFRI